MISMIVTTITTKTTISCNFSKVSVLLQFVKLFFKFNIVSELNYIFGSPYTGFSVDTGTRQLFTEADKEVSKQMMMLWTNYAKYG